MGKLKIIAEKGSESSKSNKQGHLFENLMSKVLDNLGYAFSGKPNVRYSGMEIDIEGEKVITKTPLYAECKYFEKEIDSPKFRQFYANYMTKWFKNPHCEGLFIAIPGINSEVKGFYKDNCVANTQINIKVLNEDDVIDVIIRSQLTVHPDVIKKLIDPEIGNAGDWNLLYTEKGLFWIQYIIPRGSGIANTIAIFDSKGDLITNSSTINYFKELYPELSDFRIVENSNFTTQRLVEKEEEQIVEVIGSSSCFEYQFPAAPQYFVGRTDILEEIQKNIDLIKGHKISSRGILFQANSGWGKSSLVLSSVDKINNLNHYAVAIDCRTATSSQFILKVTKFVMEKFGDFDGNISEIEEIHGITGFEGSINQIINIGKELEKRDKVLVIFLDQFEKIFYAPEILKRIRDFYFKIMDAQTNIILGFSWKIDLIGLTNDFPYIIRDEIKDTSICINLRQFSDIETKELFKQLETEIKKPLNEDLKFFISSFYQGYPWLLKKLCAHVLSQLHKGKTQRDIANSLLNIRELFDEDLNGLSDIEEETLRRIAKSAPISIQELGDDYKADIVQSLVGSRLIVRIGTNLYDVYWDIFKDFLNTNTLPVQENYLLRTSPGSVIKGIEILSDNSGQLSISDFIKNAKLTQKSYYNVARDMRLLGIVAIKNEHIQLTFVLPQKKSELNFALKNQIHDKIQYNRLVKQIVIKLDEKEHLTLDEISDLLANSSPYITASKDTWNIYANILLIWIDFTDLAKYDKNSKILSRYISGQEVKKENLVLPMRRGGLSHPIIQYVPIEVAAIRIAEAAFNQKSIIWDGFGKSTIQKVLATLEDFDFIRRGPKSIIVEEKLFDFVNNPKSRPQLFAEGANKYPIFKSFIEILNEQPNRKMSSDELYQKIKEKANLEWSKETIVWIVKLLLNWAKYTQLAPEIYSKHDSSIDGQSQLKLQN